MQQFMRLSVFAGILLMSACSTSVESQFKKACRDGGGNRAFCSCLYEQISESYGEKGLQSIATRQQRLPDDYNDKVLQATYHCASKQL